MGLLTRTGFSLPSRVWNFQLQNGLSIRIVEFFRRDHCEIRARFCRWVSTYISRTQRFRLRHTDGRPKQTCAGQHDQEDCERAQTNQSDQGKGETLYYGEHAQNRASKGRDTPLQKAEITQPSPKPSCGKSPHPHPISPPPPKRESAIFPCVFCLLDMVSLTCSRGIIAKSYLSRKNTSSRQEIHRR